MNQEQLMKIFDDFLLYMYIYIKYMYTLLIINSYICKICFSYAFIFWISSELHINVQNDMYIGCKSFVYTTVLKRP